RSLVHGMSEVTQDCWLYRFDYESPAAQLSGLGTFHGSELPYVFGSFPVPLAYGRGSRLMSDRLMTYLITFMENGNSNREGYFEWPRYSADDEQMLHINLPFSSGPVTRTEQFDLITEAGIW